MFLFQKRFHAGLLAGKITLSFRLWPQARVKPGGRYRVHPIGVVEVDALERIRLGDLCEEDAQAAGFVSRAELVEYLRPVAKGKLTARTELFRVRLHHGGDGDRVPGALDDSLSDEQVADLKARLRRLDGDAPWTRRTLKLIQANPRVAASKLAKKLKRQTAPFKAEVVKLKKLGLTQSFEVGYEVSPRGRAFLRR